MDASSSLLPEPIHCHMCTVLMLRARDKQMEEGTPLHEVMVMPASHAYTFEPQTVLGQVISVPVCIFHIAYKAESVLRV